MIDRDKSRYEFYVPYDERSFKNSTWNDEFDTNQLTQQLKHQNVFNKIILNIPDSDSGVN